MNILSILLFTFALLTDTHISLSNATAQEDLRRSVEDINQKSEIEFVIITGDVSDLGDHASLQKTQSLLSALRVPYYAIPGNHDTNRSESGLQDFMRVFGSDRFAFAHAGAYFIGFNSGSPIRGSKGHVTAQDIAWLKHQLDSVKRSSLITHHSSLNPTPIFVFTHYPLLPGEVDNWSKVTKVLRKYNVQCILGGHYHRNIFFDCDGISNVLNRSNQRGNDTINGYSIISVSDSIRFYERRLGEKAKGERREAKEAWLCLPFIVHN